MEDCTFWSDIVKRDSVIESLKQEKNVLKTVFDGHEPYSEKTPLEKIKAAIKELVPICVKDLDKKNRLYDRINSLELDDEILENPQEVLDEVCEHLDAEWPNLFITIDHKFSVDDVAYNIRQALKENFGLADFTLPKEADYLGIPYLLRDVWIDFELALKAIDSDLQLTFLETDTDSYFLVLHKEIGKWGILYEYKIPRRAKRIDVTIITKNIIFIIEFKNHEKIYKPSDISQLEDYCLDIRDFHFESKNKIIVPILLCTDAPSIVNKFEKSDDFVQKNYFANSQNISEILLNINKIYDSNIEEINYYCFCNN
jgi:hypothetical protein